MNLTELTDEQLDAMSDAEIDRLFMIFAASMGVQREQKASYSPTVHAERKAKSALTLAAEESRDEFYARQTREQIAAMHRKRERSKLIAERDTGAADNVEWHAGLPLAVPTSGSLKQSKPRNRNLPNGPLTQDAPSVLDVQPWLAWSLVGDRTDTTYADQAAVPTGHAMRGGQFRIETDADLLAAIAAVRSGKVNTESGIDVKMLMQHINKRAAEMGRSQLVPWLNTESEPNEVTLISERRRLEIEQCDIANVLSAEGML